ncbi:MAG: carbohydrate binding family 9 domain-containing protein [Candidatus Aegiribacteria sp.]|nr:carbohydrate binding family 9 domain-containing protein [Candidatus Aegiribacteria sp.]
MQAFWLMMICVISNPGSELVAVRVEEGPSIDGCLDDPVWEEAQALRCTLMQYGPDYGSLMTEETEIFIIYDDHHIYFGFKMNDPDPSTMMDALTPRDNYVTGEWIAVLLDTWGNGREATSFEVSLSNSQMDSKISPHGNWDYSWDAVWESGTHSDSQGWSAEFAIPFSCLRFDQSSETQDWTINFQRILGKTHENGWYVLSEAQQMAQLETFAPIIGIEEIEGSLGAEIRPFGSSRFFHTAEPDEWETDLNAGLDVKLGVTSGVAADLTVYPDFGQVEADAAEMNLSHFELFLEERRPFFLESQNTFEMPFNMFYSRRIGAVAPNGDVIPIIGGAKLSGSLGGGIHFGFLDAVTSSVSEDTLLITPASNYGILRTVMEFGPYSYIGFSGVSKDIWEQEGFSESYNQAFALDGAILIPGNHVIELAGARSFNTDMESDEAYRASFYKVRSTFSYSAGWETTGENFDVNGTGFTTATGGWESWGNVHKTFLPEETFSRLGFNGGIYYSELNTGEITGRNFNIEASSTLKNGAYFGTNVNYSGETFDPYEGPEGHTYDDRTSFHAWAGTNQFDDYFVSGNIGGGQYDCEGTFENYNLTFRVKPSQALELRLSGNWFLTRDTENYNWSAGDWDKRRTDWKSLILRAGYIFNPNMHLRLFSQYSRFSMDYALTGESESSDITANLLFSWQYLPGSMFYFLVKNQFAEREEGGFGTPDIGCYAKLTWYLPI